ncbi:multifunctional 2',3'-cyclic-nucleotide 2'-phosphodiesterase/5'-nucleotidase/3'-nucleotidase [Alphaproteobacteria bacterium GH1-50]|uniref:Multifunctional 2',3'-cyclic-nucleotide 2'-phosphodiesterase/5'-nucleotidase/3'-nucleotidase n=1 Tax=Kangsaoukella pontilimi TaxID=2691042 RepID=A0A7C9IUA5_9RHOB|nr:bifunctional metallophosphatase/5'-nucleotidase [Kangsaoukella pontilimi]MXQ09605.1 multifunctional 2',3'-cyclic-nucleotide 2'-phosphodiesterase/5'-nucleotidase/3'-nucleotidase [Kangsaoukella pontilimi]
MKTLLAGAAALALSTGVAAADYSITILHTNDFHDRFEPISRFNSGCSEEDNAAGECFGGAARMVTAIADAKARNENWLLLDAGDQFQGTLFFQYYKGDVQAEIMNKLGFDAMAVGNHEFNNGPEGLASFVEKVEFPVLMSNADISMEAALSGLIQKSVVIEKAGERIGIVGVTPRNNDELSSPGPNIIFTDPSPAIQAEVDRLTEEGINKIIVLSHSGFATDLVIAQNTTNVDLIVGGHTNTFLSNTDDGADGPYPERMNGVPIVQAYAFGKYLGELQLTFDDGGNVIEAVGEPILIDASVAEDAETKARIAELAEPLDEIRNRVVAQSAGFIEGDRSVCRVEECAMGNLVADAMLDRVKDLGIDIAFANSGGIRSSIDEGEVTMGEVMTVLPFQNTLATFSASGQTLIDALENGVSQVEEVAGRFPQVAGMTFTWDPSAEPGSRIVSVEVGGQPIDPAATYGVVTNNYVRNGGDGYAMFASAEDAYDFGPDLADVLAEYMVENGPAAPVVEGRIVKK